MTTDAHGNKHDSKGLFTEKVKTPSQRGIDTPAPFVFNNNLRDVEQVRPYFDAYMAVFEELDAEGKFPYNDEFKGRIPGLEGEHEDTGIYLLQTMRHHADLNDQVEEWKGDAKVREITAADIAPDEEIRCDIAMYGFYTGGTGFETLENVRLTNYRGSLVYMKGYRDTARYLNDAGTVLIKRK